MRRRGAILRLPHDPPGIRLDRWHRWLFWKHGALPWILLSVGAAACRGPEPGPPLKTSFSSFASVVSVCMGFLLVMGFWPLLFGMLVRVNPSRRNGRKNFLLWIARPDRSQTAPPPLR